ncbi:hypothetical protein PIB30_043959 [Stylosanthes scabra]|uniref:Putative plant transposon protein domain-containing protein n=1 Tax=Stylosanthes scabra TaxID=79078 RepID=A0ABU6YEJ8_9FABA|nr:hypothetical protein [Stylosanthes scabra]
MGFDYHAHKYARSLPNSQNSKTCKPQTAHQSQFRIKSYRVRKAVVNSERINSEQLSNKINNSVLNAKATAWHKIIMANIDPKTHGTKFDLKHAFFIYVLMTDGDVNLPRLMRDILLARQTKHPNHLLPFPVFIMRVANRHEVDTYVPYGDRIGERARAPARQRRQPPSQDHPAEQLPQPEISAAPSASAQPAIDRSYQQIMRHLERQERLLRRQGRQITNTQLMIRQAFPDAVFEGFVSDDSSGSTEAKS